MGEPVLSVQGISRRFGAIQAVRDLSFHVDPGETYGLLGPNGAGKSTAISICVGLLAADAGRVEVLGRAVTTTDPEARRAIGLVPQDIAVYPDLTARENLRFFGRLHGLSGDDLDRRVEHVLGVIGLADRADDKSSTFSGGMNRRLNIGIGLLHEPQLLVLDEPTVGVDPQSRNQILDSVAELAGAGLAVVYTTHYMEEAERLCDRIGILDEGELKAEGTRRELTTIVGEQARIRIGATGPLDAAAEAIRPLAGIGSVSLSEGRLDVLAADAGAAVAPVVQAVTAAGASITGVEIDEPDLEDVFLHLTGKALRD